MATYTPTRKPNADLLVYAQIIDPSATAVDGTAGAVTTTTIWTGNQKMLWLAYWYVPGSYNAA